MILATRNGMTLDQWREKYDSTPKQPTRRRVDTPFVSLMRDLERACGSGHVQIRVLQHMAERCLECVG